MKIRIQKFLYGDIPDEPSSGRATSGRLIQEPLWEVFIRSRQGLDHKHAGSLHAPDAQTAIQHARDVYTRRMEGVSIWVVESRHIHATNPQEADNFFDPAQDKIYRHPTFYPLPEEVKNM